jgi:glycosyltransferase involved in cell wall biosynthesis
MEGRQPFVLVSNAAFAEDAPPNMPSQRPLQPVLGLVIPCYNEAAVLPRLLAELEKLAETAGVAVKVLFIDDGSRDATFEIIAKAAEKNPNLACLRFSRNFGHQTAVYAGILNSRADVVGIMDADLQDPPQVLLQMVGQWRAGYDVVYGVRQKRKEGLVLRAAYAGFYRLFQRISQVEMPLDAGDFCVMDRRVVEVLQRMPEQSPFLRGLRSWVGFRQIGIPYDRPQRAAGRTKYNWSRLTNLAIQGLVSFSSVPLRLATWLGLLASALGFALLIWATISALLLERIPPGWASLAVMVLFFGGIQLIMLGVLGEYVGRIFEQVKNRPLYVVESQAGWLETSAK